MLMNDQDSTDVCNALDVLCGCYAEGVHSSTVKSLLLRYAPGTEDGDRARELLRRFASGQKKTSPEGEAEVPCLMTV